MALARLPATSTLSSTGTTAIPFLCPTSSVSLPSSSAIQTTFRARSVWPFGARQGSRPQVRGATAGARGDPFLTLVVLRRLLSQLTSLVAARLFDAELQDALSPLPPLVRDGVLARIERYAARHDPEERLLLLRKKIKMRQKQSPEQGRNP